MITLKYLRDVYESEKRSLKLQPLSADFFKEVGEYFEFKKKIASKSNLKSYQIMKELENFKRLLRMLLEKREQKIISMAMRHIRSGMKVEISSMLPSEQRFFQSLVELIKENEDQLNKLLEGEFIFEHQTDVADSSLMNEKVEIEEDSKEIEKEMESS
ncbi:MAG: DNA replication complex GINS family protein, partial [Candidatus Nanohaloarchaeota archaeon]|nr:DNA replication complex GINS family protein [Candidatus Nanohaloarchaeota archaeon]